jgi:hypothetical protein
MKAAVQTQLTRSREALLINQCEKTSFSLIQLLSHIYQIPVYCDMTLESQNSEARDRLPLMINDKVSNMFPLQRLAETRFRDSDYADMNRGVVRRLSQVFMATEHNREKSTVLLCDLYSVRMKLVQSEIQRSRKRIQETRDSSRIIVGGFNS